MILGIRNSYVSFEDDLMVRFGTDRVKTLMQSSWVYDDQCDQVSKMFTKSIETAQKRVEGNNFDIT